MVQHYAAEPAMGVEEPGSGIKVNGLAKEIVQCPMLPLWC